MTQIFLPQCFLYSVNFKVSNQDYTLRCFRYEGQYHLKQLRDVQSSGHRPARKNSCLFQSVESKPFLFCMNAVKFDESLMLSAKVY